MDYRYALLEDVYDPVKILVLALTSISCGTAHPPHSEGSGGFETENRASVYSVDLKALTENWKSGLASIPNSKVVFSPIRSADCRRVEIDRELIGCTVKPPEYKNAVAIEGFRRGCLNQGKVALATYRAEDNGNNGDAITHVKVVRERVTVAKYPARYTAEKMVCVMAYNAEFVPLFCKNARNEE